MSRRLPPLNALRAFEVAGRHLSFSRAAAELHVTPAAVSHQVKGLEEFLGVQLFRRLNKALLLTDAGQAMLPALREGFDRLDEAVKASRAAGAHRALTVSVAPSFGARWLVPRLYRFRQGHPGFDVRIDATHQLVDFARDDVDLAIRYGTGAYPGLAVERLFDDEVFPVCSPRLLGGDPPLAQPDDLRHHTLIHIRADDPAPWPDWEMWLHSAGVEGVDWSRGLQFSHAAMALQAAAEGQGVVLGTSVTTADDIAAGRLCKPFAHAMASEFSYYLVYAEKALARPKVAAFRDWLRAEAEQSGHVVAAA